jgi:hypothetical protein
MFLRERRPTPWHWLTDETRSMIHPGYRATRAEAAATLDRVTEEIHRDLIHGPKEGEAR